MAFQNKMINTCILLVCVLCLILSGCGTENTTKSNRKYTGVADSSFSNIIRYTDGYSPAAENDRYKLEIEGSSASVAIVDKETGKRWTTNPENRSEDNVADGTWSQLLNSQIQLSYIRTSDGISVLANSYNDAVKNEQFDFYPVENGIGVHYLIGEEIKRTLYPTVLTSKRFKHFLEKLDDADKLALEMYYVEISADSFTDKNERNLMLERYPELKNQSLYVLSAATGTSVVPGSLLAEEIEGLFEKAGYDEDELAYDQKQNGIEPDKVYDTSIDICIEYILTDDGLSVLVPTDKLNYDRTSIIITEISLLPCFGAADYTKNGYIFIPDGSGAIIELNNGKTNIPAYEKKVYGKDASLSGNEYETDTEDDGVGINLPVFGIKEDDRSFLAIIEEGDSVAEINADVSMKSSIYNYVYASFKLKESHVVTQSALNLSGSLVYQQSEFSSDLKISYFPVAKTSDYSDMALVYQRYLKDNGCFSENSVQEGLPFNINLIGSSAYRTTVLGISVERQKKLTSYSEAQEILSIADQKGIKNISLRFEGWCNDGMFNSVFDGIRLTDSLGKASDLKALVDFTQKKGMGFYPASELQYVSKNRLTDGYRINRDTAKNLEKGNAVYYTNSIASAADENKGFKWVTSPMKYQSLLSDVLEDYKDYSIKGIDFASLSTEINSDYNEENLADRSVSEKKTREIYKKAVDEGISVSADGANAYVIEYCSLITDVPEASGAHYLIDKSVPFYQIVLHGMVPFTGEAINLCDDVKQSFLKCVETGSGLSFCWIYADNTALMDTKLDLYSVNYSQWMDEAADMYARASKVLSDLCNDTIVSHSEYADGVYKTVYSDGTAVWVNYNSEDYKTDLITVPAEDFIAERKAADEQ